MTFTHKVKPNITNKNPYIKSSATPKETPFFFSQALGTNRLCQGTSKRRPKDISETFASQTTTNRQGTYLVVSFI